MSPEETRQLDAMRAAYEQTIMNMAHQDADRAATVEMLSIRANKAEARVKELEDKYEPKPVVEAVK